MKEYLGDSVYAQYDGETLVLTTENGYADDPRNKIVLEPSALRSLALLFDRAWLSPYDRDATERFYRQHGRRGVRP